MIQKFNTLLEKLHANVTEAANTEFCSFKHALGKIDASKGEMQLVTAGSRAVNLKKGVYSDAGNRVRATIYFIFTTLLTVVTVPAIIVAVLASPSLAMQENKVNRFVVDVFKLFVKELMTATEMLVTAVLLSPALISLLMSNEKNEELKIEEPVVQEPAIEELVESPFEECLRKANEGDAKAQFELYQKFSLENGDSPKTAMEWLEKAAVNHHPQAQLELGRKRYRHAQEEMAMESFLEKAAAYPHPQAQLRLGREHYWDAQEESDPAKSEILFKEAKNLFKASAQQVPGEANYDLALCYHRGHGTEENNVKAREHFQLAVDCNIEEAVPYLAHYLLQGFGGEKDFKKGFDYLDRSVTNKDPKGLYAMGSYLAEGTCGFKKDVSKAKQLLEEAGGLGHGNAKAKLEQLNKPFYKKFI